jgi:hypothetical protein
VVDDGSFGYGGDFGRVSVGAPIAGIVVCFCWGA